MDISDDPVAAQYDYHPCGLQHTNAELAASGNDYRLGGKERQERFGVPYYDFGARLYDGIEWCSTDVLSEKFRSIGPYVYCAGNPINFVDPTGMKVDIADLNKEHREALALMLSTQDGWKFIGRYMEAGGTLTVVDNPIPLRLPEIVRRMYCGCVLRICRKRYMVKIVYLQKKIKD